ncbi:MAG: cytochrome P450 [bacterium]|nr:cytochrome P450 [bacterium]
MAAEAPDILSPAFNEDPYPILAALREDHPLYFHEQMNSYLITRYDDVSSAFKNPVFTTLNYEWQLEPVHGPTLLSMEGRNHSRYRNLVAPEFRGRVLQESFLPVIERNSAELLDAWRHDGYVDFVQQYTTWFPVKVIVDMLGLPAGDHAVFHRWYTTINVYLANLAGDPEINAAGEQVREDLEAYMLPVIEDRRHNPRDDLLTKLVHAEVDGERLGDIEIKSFVSLLLTAGGETTDRSLTNMFWRLIENPRQMAAVREDRSLIRNAFAETLRHTPPVLMIMRQPSEDVEVTGGVIPAGSTVTCLLAGANRDPRAFEDPDRFDIFRDDLDVERAFTSGANHLTFALGRHFCVGALLALTEVVTGAGQVLDACEDLAFANGPPTPEGVFTRSPLHMDLTFTPAS